MNKFIKSIYSICLVLAMVLSMGINVSAAGSTSLAVSNSSLGVGDTTTVTVKASTSAKVTVKYTASMLSFESCDAADYSAESNSVAFTGTEANIKFKAIGEGTASIIVSGSGVSGSSTTVAISGTGTGASSEPASDTSTDTPADTGEGDVTEDAPAEDATPEPTITYSGTGYLNDAGNFEIDGVEYVVSERYSDAEIPAGFSKLSVSIGSHTYKELSNGSLTILYLKPASNTAGSGEFYLYDAENATVSLFSFVSAGGHYILLGTAGYKVFEDMSETTVTIGGTTCVAYVLPGSEFYYIFGTDERGILDWYSYDPTYDEFGRIDTVVLDMIAVSNDKEAVEESTYDPTANYVAKLAKFRKVIAVLAVICILLLFALLKVKFLDSMESDDEEPVFGTSSKSKRVKPAKAARPAKRERRPIKFIPEDDEDDEDDEEDEDTDDGPATPASKPVAPVTKPSATPSKNSGVIDLNDL